MSEYGHSALCTYDCGSIVHPTKRWLGALPDVKVTDTSCDNQKVLWNLSVHILKGSYYHYEDKHFIVHRLVGIFIKEDHDYYHQIQLQLYVGLDMYSWCDFCILTNRMVSVEYILQ